MTLPTRGFCHGAVLLAGTASLRRWEAPGDWIAAAQRAPTFMATALSLEDVAAYLVDAQFVTFDTNGINTGHGFGDTGTSVNFENMLTVAKLVLRRAPPPWLNTATAGNQFRPELVPDADLAALAWIEPFLGPLLLDLRRQGSSEAFRRWLGAAGELAVVAGERAKGRRARRVSLVSDSLGFDVASELTGERLCIEVKTTLPGRRDSFFISRNELKQSLELASGWLLVQVVLDPTDAAAWHLTADSVQEARVLNRAVASLCPADSAYGSWVGSARITPPEEAWSDWDLSLPQTWAHTG